MSLRNIIGSTASIVDKCFVYVVAKPFLLFYKKIGSPFFYMLGSRCRFYPSCSAYSEEAIGRFGFFKGFYLSFIRFAKCSPLHPGGFDPVPDVKKREQ